MLLPQKFNQTGVHKTEIRTPALLLDLDAMERNLRKMADFFSKTSATLRPHSKTHRTPALCRRQLAAGARGICCGNLDDAELMIRAGIRDVLVTREIVSPQDIARVVRLAHDSEIIITVDDAAVAERFSRAAVKDGVRLRALVDVNVRLGRVGIPPGEPARNLARQVARAKGLNFMGVMGYEGGMHDLSATERERECRAALEKLIHTRDLIAADGIEVQTVSAGATSTHRVAGVFPGITEIQAGSYLTYESRYHRTLPGFEIALSVLTTVVSRPGRDRVTTDAGKKKLSAEAGLPQPKAVDGLKLVGLHEEHGLLEASGSAQAIQVGAQVEFVPTTGCTTIHMYDRILGMRNDRVEEVLEIGAREI